ncbi:P-type DNA transfer ATPase VirB11 [Brucella intermedia]|uniref:P-type DNA transfer ATPase VirB11 n=1 Tax=Brucella intermedia TaxID=94625 RepID=UPI002360D361|nr:P-type DNA transfer ATPase VirB11 [Brucella intermedia]
MNMIPPYHEIDIWARFPILHMELEPLQKFLQDEKVSELSINRPGELFIERLGESEMERVVVKDLSAKWIVNIATLVASATNQIVNEERPLLSAALPTGERIQCVLPPAAPDGGAISIRKQVIREMTLDDYAAAGAFEGISMGTELGYSDGERELISRLSGDPVEFIDCAIRNHVSIVVSGGTSTGKTTFLNAMLKLIPPHERIILIEDTRELKPVTSNSLSLLTSKGAQGLAQVDTQDLLEASLRMRPDRIMLGELRGAEAFTFLQAINTGHPGSLTTVHANSARSAYERLALMVMQGGVRLSHDELVTYLKETLPIVIQLSRNGSGRRIVSEIKFTKAEVSGGICEI